MKRFAPTLALGLLIALAWSGSHATPDQLLQLSGSAAPIPRAEADALSKDLIARAQRSAGPGALARIRLLHQPLHPAPQVAIPKAPSKASSSPPVSAQALPARKAPRAGKPRGAQPPKTEPRETKPMAPVPTPPHAPPEGNSTVTDFSKQLLRDAQRVGQGKGASTPTKARGTQGKISAPGTKQGRLHAAPDEASKGQPKRNGAKSRGKQGRGSFGGGQGPGEGLAPGKQHGR